MSISKVLVATDFSEQAELAIRHALAVCRHTGAEMVLMHAMSVSNADFSTPYPIATPVLYPEQLTDIQKDCRDRLQKERETIAGQGVEVSQVFVDDMPEPGIQRVASDSEVDLIVVGTHGRKGLARFLVGSVAQRVAARAACDVLVARNEPPSGSYKGLLVPTDFSDCSDRALERALQLVESGGTITLAHFWQLPGGPVSYWGSVGPGLRESIIKGAQDYGQKLIEKHKDADCTIQFMEKEVDPRHGIQDQLDTGNFDLVVMGSHGRKGLNKFLLGSVAEATLRHATHSLYIARAQ